jgi:hypothetical protein
MIIASVTAEVQTAARFALAGELKASWVTINADLFIDPCAIDRCASKAKDNGNPHWLNVVLEAATSWRDRWSTCHSEAR